MIKGKLCGILTVYSLSATMTSGKILIPAVCGMYEMHALV